MTAPRVVVIRGGAIGDFILTLPVLSALRKQFPACRLEVIGYPHIVALAQAGGLADEVRPIEARAMAGFFARGGDLDKELADYFSGAAIILAFLYDPDGIFAANVGRCTKAQYIAGPHRPDEARGLHATRVFLEPLQRLAIFDADPVPRLGSWPGVGRSARVRWLAMHPGSGSVRKNWPRERWLELVEAVLAGSDLGLLLVGGEAEAGLLETFEERFAGPRVRCAMRLPLPELAAQLADCAAFVGHDSGITHLASALGLPGLVLWGPSSEGVWAPLSERLVLLRAGDGLAHLSVSTVHDALLNLLASLEDARPEA